MKDFFDIVKAQYWLWPLSLFFALCLLHVVPASNLEAGGKLQRAHKTVRMVCKDCHHKPIKKCSKCHTSNGRKVKAIGDMPRHLQTVHKKCAGCHSKYPSAQGNQARVAIYLKKRSDCRTCH